MKTKKSLIASVIINFIIFAVTTGIVTSYFLGNLSPWIKSPQESFMFFTTDSNILAAAASLTVAICNILVIRGKIKEIPKFALIFKLMGVVSLFLTFSTVMLLLVPIYGPEMQLGRTGFHMHVGAPVMSFISFAFLDGFKRIKLSYIPVGMIPMAIYGVVYLTEVVFIGVKNGGWFDFYALNQNGNWFISVVVMFSAAAVLSAVTILVHNLFYKKSTVRLEKNKK